MSINFDKLKNNIKKEFQGWKNFEILILLILSIILIFNGVYLRDNPISICSACCGILYTVIAGKGKISCYLFGLSGSFLYGYLAFINGLYGNVLLYVLYYIPMQIAGIYKWSKNLNIKTNEIYKSSVKNKGILAAISLILCVITWFILRLVNDSAPVYDGISTALSLVGMYLTVKRCIEQWIVWGIVNFVSVVMWIKVAMRGENVYSTILMWLTYLFLSFYFYIQWRRELSNEKKAG